MTRKLLITTNNSMLLRDFIVGEDPPQPKKAEGSQWRQPVSPSDLTINAATVGWMKQLPSEVAPVELAVRYPRILNRLARFWDIPGMIHEYFEDLIFVKRVRRKGFPAKVKAEIIALCNYYQTIHPITSSDLWDAVPHRVPQVT